MLTAEANQRYTEVGPGTACGELMRRYWHPVAARSELTGINYTLPVRLLGEDLVLYRDRSGTLGLIGSQCPHRKMGMIYGVPEQNGLRCPYHGWLFNETGACLEMPYEEAEDPSAAFREKVSIASYPVEVLGGLVWAYLGPQPAPLLPRWDYLVMEDLQRDVAYSELPCNWLQCQENSLDPVHVEWLHGRFSNFIEEQLGRPPKRTRSKHSMIGFDAFDYGLIKRHGYEGSTEEATEWADGHPIIFPYTLRQGGDGWDRERWSKGNGPAVQIRVPIDDNTTAHWWLRSFQVEPGDAQQKDEDVPFLELPIPSLDRRGRPQWQMFDANPPQDLVAWFSQGVIQDRTTETLGRSDKGIIMFRQMLEDNIKVVEDGGDPINTFRDPGQNVYHGMRTEDSRFWIPQGQAGRDVETNGADNSDRRDRRRFNRFGGLTQEANT
jgi:5,5'-dehydrodivanillate O-demethylase oxygenase subunit